MEIHVFHVVHWTSMLDNIHSYDHWSKPKAYYLAVKWISWPASSGYDLQGDSKCFGNKEKEQ